MSKSNEAMISLIIAAIMVAFGIFIDSTPLALMGVIVVLGNILVELVSFKEHFKKSAETTEE